MSRVETSVFAQKPDRLNFRNIGWCLLIIIIALVARLYGLDNNSLRLDEGITFIKSHLGLDTLVFSPTDNKPPLYYILTKPFLLLGDSEFALRLPSAILMSLTVGTGFFLGREVGGRSGSLILPLLLLVHDVNLEIAQDARHYSLLSLSIIVATTALLGLLRDAEDTSGKLSLFGAQRGKAAVFVCASLVALYTHPISLYYLFTIAFGAVTYTAARGTWRSFLPGFILIELITFIFWIPWFFVLVGLLQKGGTIEHYQWVSWVDAANAFLDLFGVRFVWYLGAFPSLLMSMFALGGVYLLFRVGKGASACVIGVALVLAPLLIWGTGLIKPIFHWRVIGPTHIFAATAVAALLSNITFPKMRALLLAGVLFSMSKSAYGYYMTFNKEQWREAVAYVSSTVRNQDVIAICQPWGFYPLMFYWRELPSTLVAVGEGVLLMVNWNLALSNLKANMEGRPTVGYPAIAPDEFSRFQQLYLIDRQKSCKKRLASKVFSNYGVDFSAPAETVRFSGISVMRLSLNR